MSIRSLARKLDLSITTVSRALAGYDDVRKSTRERVVAAARADGYTPNASARKLKLGRAETLGIVLQTNNDAFGDPFYSELIAGVGNKLSEIDHDLVVTACADPEAEVGALKRLIDGRKVDGLIVPRTRWRDRRIDYLIERGFPFVTHGRTARAAEHAWLDVDGEQAFDMAATRLVFAGHRRIALINAPEEFSFSRYRQAGYESALRKAGIGLDPSLIAFTKKASIRAGELAALDLLRAKERPTALLCATDRLAIGALAAIQTAGLQAGSDISVIGYDDLYISAHTSPPLTTLSQPIRDVGRRLVDLLLKRAAGVEPGSLQELWEATLVVRGSDGKGPHKRAAPPSADQ